MPGLLVRGPRWRAPSKSRPSARQPWNKPHGTCAQSPLIAGPVRCRVAVSLLFAQHAALLRSDRPPLAPRQSLEVRPAALASSRASRPTSDQPDTTFRCSATVPGSTARAGCRTIVCSPVCHSFQRPTHAAAHAEARRPAQVLHIPDDTSHSMLHCRPHAFEHERSATSKVVRASRLGPPVLWPPRLMLQGLRAQA